MCPHCKECETRLAAQGSLEFSVADWAKDGNATSKAVDGGVGAKYEREMTKGCGKPMCARIKVCGNARCDI
jgi:hypothetical protein